MNGMEPRRVDADDLALMKLRANTLFTYDDHGRMALTNEPCEIARRPAPRLFIGRAGSGSILRIGADVPQSRVEPLAALASTEAPMGDGRVAPALLAAMRPLLEQDGPVTEETSGPAYLFPDLTRTDGDVVRLTEDNRTLARQTFPWLEREWADWQPCFIKVEDGAAVAACYSARIGARVAEAGVDTLPDFRGRGYATALVAAWGGAIRASGRIPLYSTSWDNIASRGVARRLGLIMFGSDAPLT
jgi:GNAT superfamily N-acetyltransferase